MPRVLLTGATGFVGRACVEPLRRHGFEVHGVARRPGWLGPGVPVHAADLLDRDATAELIARVRPTHLLHLAWIASPGLYWTSPLNEAWAEASVHLAREFLSWGGERLVAAGTCAEYDWSGGVCRETTTPLRPTAPYGRAKLATYEQIARLAEEFGSSYAWPRLFFLYGPHEHPKRLIASVTRALLQGQDASCSEGSQRRDFLHVNDAGEALAQLLASEFVGPVNVGSGEAVSVREIVSYLADSLGALKRVRWGARSADEAPLVVADVNRLHQEVGFRPQFDWRAGLRDVMAYWRSHHARAA